MQLRVYSDRFAGWRPDWQRVRAGKVSAVTNTYFLASESVKVRMRVKTIDGTSSWSKARALGRLRHC